MIRRLAVSLAVAGLGFLVIRSMPDVARYLKMREM
ncbi:MAG: hypothetical protein QOJ44_1617 [Acidimicrobiaceae bacterium]|jgi:hypothetical protein|nr:hypothetical protein [Acidimicrobiaceae bacterium]